MYIYIYIHIYIYVLCYLPVLSKYQIKSYIVSGIIYIYIHTYICMLYVIYVTCCIFGLFQGRGMQWNM